MTPSTPDEEATAFVPDDVLFAPMPDRLTVGLRAGTTVEAVSGSVVVHHPWGRVSVDGPAWLHGVLATLSHDELDVEGIIDALIDAGVSEEGVLVAALAEMDRLFEAMPMIVQRSVYRGPALLLRLVPVSADAPASGVSALPPDWALSMDHFAYLRRRDGESGLVLESPLAHHRAHLGAELVGLLGRLAGETVLAGEVVAGSATAAVSLLVSAGLLHAGPPGTVDPAPSTWSFHDLAFHAKSRQGRTDEAFGAFLRHAERIPPPPAEVRRSAATVVPLVAADFDATVRSDLTLTEALETRSSVRSYDPRAISVDEVLLYRTARTRSNPPVLGIEGYVGADHPYPTGGLAGDLEIYVTAAACDGLDPGAYHYNANEHQLELVASLEASTPLLRAAQIACGGELEPQVLLTFTSRFARTAWKYDSIAYSLTLKHVGVLMQTIYLVATSMALGPCALGSGDADSAASVFGLDWLEESSVGEMLLGRPSEPTPISTSFRDAVTRGRTVG